MIAQDELSILKFIHDIGFFIIIIIIKKKSKELEGTRRRTDVALSCFINFSYATVRARVSVL
jgi:hypothetical protein